MIALLLVLQCTALVAQQKKTTLKAGAAGDENAMTIDVAGTVKIEKSVAVGGDLQVSGQLKGNTQLNMGSNVHMDGKALYFRETVTNPNAHIIWNKQNDRLQVASWIGVELGDLNRGFKPILSVGVTTSKLKTDGTYDYFSTPAVDIRATERSGTHPTDLALYVTGDINQRSKSIQFRNEDASQGIGFTMNAIYTAGSVENQDLNLEVVKKGKLIFKTDDQLRMVINGNGFVGVGISDPNVPFHVKNMGATTNYDYQHQIDNNNAYMYMPYGVAKQTVSTNRRFNSCSILAEGEIVSKTGLVATQALVFSDIRLKKNVRRSSSFHDLELLKKIEVADYKMIDTIANDRSYKKVIAQQVQKVYPNAVNTSSNTLPDVFQKAQQIKKLNDSTYTIALTKPHHLKKGDLLELKCPAQDGAKGLVTVVNNNTSFTVISKTPLNEQEYVFVYGREVSDVLTVDYDAISMLNVSATQQLAKVIDEQQQKIQQLTQENERLKKEQASTQTTMANILERLVKVEQNNTKTVTPSHVVALVK